MPLISIVIPCRNEEKHIEKCLTSFINSDFDFNKIEILVCDGMSSDNTRNKIKAFQSEFKNIKIIDNPLQKTPFALNQGIENANGEYILIASAHSSFDQDYIRTLINKIKEHDCAAVGGIMITKVLNKNLKSNSIIEVLSNKFGVGNATFRTGLVNDKEVDTVPFGIYKTSLLKSLNGYDPRLIRNHDIELSKRILAMGEKIILTPDTKCYYYARETFNDIAKNNYRNGKWNILTVYITKKFSSLSIRHFIPLIFVLSLIVPLIIGFLIYAPIAILGGISLIAYLALILKISISLKKEQNSIYHLVKSFLVLHLSYGVGSLVGIFKLNYLFK